MAIVILAVLHGRRFVSVDERVQFQKDIEHKFYFAFRQAFDALNETYMQVEKNMVFLIRLHFVIIIIRKYLH